MHPYDRHDIDRVLAVVLASTARRRMWAPGCLAGLMIAGRSDQTGI